MPRSRTFKIVHTLYLLVIAVLMTLLFVERQKQPDEPSTSELSEQLESTQQALATRVSNLSEQIDSRFVALEERLPAPQAQDEPRRTAPPSSTEAPPVDALNDNTDASSESTDSTLNSDDYARLGSAMVDNFTTHQDAFEMQSVDPDWANHSLELIRDLFAEDDYLSQLHVADIECRSSICQLDIDVADPAALDPARLLKALNQLNQNQQGFAYQLLTQPLDSTYRVLLLRTHPAAD